MKNQSRRHPAAFTLIEIMAVITIIAILAGIVVGGLSFVKEKQAREKTKVQIALLSKAIEEYKLDMGAYPGATSAYGGGAATAMEGDSSQVLYNALFKEGFDYTDPDTPPDDWGTKATKIYLPELDPRNSKQGWVTSSTATTPPADLKIIDPWRNNYRYRTGSNTHNPDFDLWSFGKDGDSNTATTAAGLTDPKTKDDIRNF